MGRARAIFRKKLHATLKGNLRRSMSRQTPGSRVTSAVTTLSAQQNGSDIRK